MSMSEHEPVRSTGLGTLQGLIFEELDNLMALDLSDADAIQAEMSRAKAVHDMASVAIDNANTVCRVVQMQAESLGAVKEVPRMLGA